nr:hypothetical protein [Microcystis aeruginosa]
MTNLPLLLWQFLVRKFVRARVDRLIVLVSGEIVLLVGLITNG